MSLPDSLFQQNESPAAPDLPCWLWLLELACGRVVQIACNPAAERGQVEYIARTRHGAALARVVAVPDADRVLRTAEIQWALAGRGLVQVEVMSPARWLARVAWLLECTPDQLEASGRLGTEDAERCSAAAPHLAAELIRSSGWTPPPPAEPGPRKEPIPPTEPPSFSTTWRAARDAYLSHRISCPVCIANRLSNPMYCETGEALRRAYDNATW